MQAKEGRTNNHTEKGTVLLVVLMLISILVVIAIEGFRSTQVDLSSAYLFGNGLAAQNLNRSALNYAQALLAYDGKENSFDHFGEIWAHPKNQNEIKRPSIEKGSFSLHIIDESGKLPINFIAPGNPASKESDHKEVSQDHKIYQNILKQLLLHDPFNLEKEKSEKLIKSLVDWINKDEQEENEAGSENMIDEYYADFDNTNSSKDAPMTFISELLLVEGVDEKLYYGANNQPGLKDLLTVHNEKGKININTASTYLLQAMVPSSVHRDTAKEFAQNMQAYQIDSMLMKSLK